MENPHLATLIVVAVFVAVWVWVVATAGRFLEADALTHYLFARFAWQEPHYLVSVWGRPMIKLLDMLPAALGGMTAVQVSRLVMMLACGLVTMELARRQGHRWPVVAMIFLFAQPLLFVQSFSVLTELPFALLVACGIWAYREKQWFLVSLLAGVGLLGRLEGFGFALLAAVGLILHRRPWWVPVIIVFLPLWSWAGWEVHGRPEGMAWWQWLSASWPYQAESNYGSGALLHFVWRMPLVAAPLAIPFLVVGAWRGLGQCRGLFGSDHQRRCDFVVAAIPLGILLVHSVAWWMGKFSGGLPRYLLVAAPLWALVCARGWELAWSFRFSSLGFRSGGEERRLERLAVGTAMALAAAPLLWAVWAGKLPIRATLAETTVEAVVARYAGDEHLRRKYPRVMSSHPHFYYLLDISPTDWTRAAPWGRGSVEAAPPRTLLAWEPTLASTNPDSALQVEMETVLSAGWILVEEFDLGWKLFVSPD